MDVEPVGLHGSMLCLSWIFLAKMLSIPRLHVGSMLDLPHDPGSWLGLCLCWICYVGPICWSMLDLLRCPQMCSKASVGAIGFMLDVSHVGHIFLFLDFQGGVRLKGLNSGKADSRFSLNLVI